MVNDPSGEGRAASKSDEVEKKEQHGRGRGPAAHVDGILDHAEGWPQIGVLEQPGSQQDQGGGVPGRLHEGKDVDRRADRQADGRSQRVPGRADAGHAIRDETASQCSDTGADAADEADDQAYGRQVQAEGRDEILRRELVGTIEPE